MPLILNWLLKVGEEFYIANADAEVRSMIGWILNLISRWLII